MTSILDPAHSHPFEIRNSYSHLVYDEAGLWSAFIALDPTAYKTVWYDVPVGSTPLDSLTDKSAPLARHIRQTYSKRIDVVALEDTDYAIIELKCNAGYTAFGQALIYSAAIRPLLPPGTIPRPTIITDRADPDIIEPCELHDINLIQLADLTA